MDRYILNMDEYHKTTEFFFRKELKWMTGFVYFFLALITSLLIWAYYFEIDIIVKARGVIRPDKTISSVINQYDGRLSNVEYYNGKSVAKGDILYSIDTFTYEVNLEKNMDLISRKRIELKDITILKNSIMIESLAFNSETSGYYYQYQKYSFEKQRLQSVLREAEMEYFRNKELGFDYISEMELERFRRKYEGALYDYRMHKAKTLSEIEEKSNILEEEIVNLEKEIEDLRKRIALGTVTSPISGLIQCNKVMNVGDYVPINTSLFNIVPSNSTLKMDILVQNKDISKVKINQDIKYRIDSLLYKEFGISTGIVNKISADISEDGTYLIEGAINKLRLQSKSGNVEILKIGMESDIRIVTKKKSILRIVLEKLDFMNE